MDARPFHFHANLARARTLSYSRDSRAARALYPQVYSTVSRPDGKISKRVPPKNITKTSNNTSEILSIAAHRGLLQRAPARRVSCCEKKKKKKKLSIISNKLFALPPQGPPRQVSTNRTSRVRASLWQSATHPDAMRWIAVG